jgi:hypothetical protein
MGDLRLNYDLSVLFRNKRSINCLRYFFVWIVQICVFPYFSIIIKLKENLFYYIYLVSNFLIDTHKGAKFVFYHTIIYVEVKSYTKSQ